jgi:hypothetical protein
MERAACIEGRGGGALVRLLDGAAVVTLLLIVAVNLVDIVGFARAPRAYPIGAECAGWAYSSVRLFVGVRAAMILVGALALVGGRLLGRGPTATTLRVVVAAVLVVPLFLPPG